MVMASPPRNRTEEPLDTSTLLVTPERIAFRYPLAGPFRRSLAYLLDLLVMAVAMIIGLIAISLAFFGSEASLGVYFVFLFILWWGYGALFETIFNGQTVGKMALGIRVVSDQGVPISGAQALLRNLLWVFDGFTFGFMPALACMILTRKFQRLGDLAAGTMVMVEQRPGRSGVVRVNDKAIETLLPWLPSRVDAGPELARALSDYVKHRSRFGRERREEMAGHLARPLRELFNLPADAPSDAIVCALYQRVFLGD
jgi:uncharacterized RDD family membrane protein YckC